MKKRRKRKVKKNSSTGVLTILLVVALISLFSETIRSIPVGAYSENFSKISYKVPKLNSNILEKNI